MSALSVSYAFPATKAVMHSKTTEYTQQLNSKMFKHVVAFTNATITMFFSQVTLPKFNEQFVQLVSAS